MKTQLRLPLLILTLFITTGCATPFKFAEIDPATGLFPTGTEVDKKYIKIFRPLAGIEEANYVFL